MSSSRDHSNSIFIQITRKTPISEILEGWQYWLDLGLISEEGVPAKPEFLTKSAIAKHRSLTGSGFEQSDRRFPQPTVCCQILS